MNISKKRQEEIFGKILNFINDNNLNFDFSLISKPEILNLSINDAFYLVLTKDGYISSKMMVNLNEDESFLDLIDVENIFDVLGKFSMSKPCSVFLCDELLAKCASSNSWDKDILEEIVYIHECAHYIHYHLNSGNFRNCPFNAKESSLYVETFAQLITHVISKEFSDYHFPIFEKLKESQRDVYTRYNDYIIACDKNYLLKLFLNPQPNNNENVIDFIKSDYDINKIEIGQFSPWDWDSLWMVLENLEKNKSIYFDKVLNNERLQKEIDESPDKMLIDLPKFWNRLREKKGYEWIKHPLVTEKGENVMQLKADLCDIGFD